MVAAAVIVPMLIDLSMKSRRDDGVDRDRQQRWETHTRRISRRDIMLRLILEHYVPSERDTSQAGARGEGD